MLEHIEGLVRLVDLGLLDVLHWLVPSSDPAGRVLDDLVRYQWARG